MYKLLYPDFLRKAVTFSFDDGTYCDVFAVELLNRHGLKGTFNLNSGLLGKEQTLHIEGKDIYYNHFSEEQTAKLYRGHEVASHSVHHPLLIGQPPEFLAQEVDADIAALSRIAGKDVVGFAYPGGPHDDVTDAYMRERALYARGAVNTHSYALPETFLPFDPCTHIYEKEFERICADYLARESEEIDWLFIWGHSYEFMWEGVYDALARVCRAVCRDDVWNGTNREIIGYITDARRLYARGGRLVNDTDTDVYLLLDGEKTVVPAHGAVKMRK